MTIAAGHNGIEFTVGKAGLIYSRMRADVLREYKPFIGMGKKLPVTIAT
jgi:hypothetical protein